jgi:hypothetical protein
MNDIMNLLLDKLPSGKTYLAGIGLIGLACYQLSQSQFQAAVASLSAGLGLIGLRHATTKEAP